MLALLIPPTFYYVVNLPLSVYFYHLEPFFTLVSFNAMVFLLYCVIDVHSQGHFCADMYAGGVKEKTSAMETFPFSQAF